MLIVALAERFGLRKHDSTYITLLVKLKKSVAGKKLVKKTEQMSLPYTIFWYNNMNQKI